MHFVFWIFLFVSSISWISFAKQSEVLVNPVGLTDQEHNQLQSRILHYPNVQNLLRNKTFRVLSLETEDSASAESQYNLRLITYEKNQVFDVVGPMNQSNLPQIREVAGEIPATTDEFAQAVKILNQNPDWSSEISNEKLNVYEPMPTTSYAPSDRDSGISRLINVGLMSASQPKINEIVSVDLYTKEIIRYPNGAPLGAVAAEQTCGIPNAMQTPTRRGTRGSADIKIIQDGQVIWSFNLTRPSASSGKDGSGLEIKNLNYKGQKVLSRAHTPLLNVQYEGDKCGPFRDWTYSENAFEAHGYEKAPGIMVAAHPPQTIFDTEDDKGSFQGVAIYITPEKVQLVTELSAGWYRYVSKMELYPDGTIKPLFEFSTVENSCVCFNHNHHVYWRFDFDVGEIPNSIEVSNGQSFSPVSFETVQSKIDGFKAWRIFNPLNGMGYQITPGPYDGTADDYSLGDAWLLRQKSNEIDDSRVRKSTQVGLNEFITNESLTTKDLVFWYSGHFLHSHTETETNPAIVGPTLTPLSWPQTISE